jgi:stromal membrane-associated protein
MSELGDVPKHDAPRPPAPDAEPEAEPAAASAEPEPEPAGEDEDVEGSAELLAQFQACAGNHVCADCGRPEPSWASSNTGALVCIQCCGVHRLIGTDNSAPLSVKLDSWSKDLIANMMKGNAAVNAVMEAELPAELKITPESDRSVVENFIWSKYGAKSFVEGGSKTLETMPAERAGARSQRSTSNIGILVYAGILFITCKKATKLKDKDFVGKSDPYLVARVGDAPQQAVTKVIQDNLDPEWNETLQLNVAKLDDLLMIECYDSDTISDGGKADPKNRVGDEILGIACHSVVDTDGQESWVPGIPLTGLEDGNEKDIISYLVDPTAKKQKDADGGMLMLSLKFMALDQ